MTKDEALKRAIEYLECPTQGGQKLTVINACKKALEQPAQEPVAWIYQSNSGHPALRWENTTSFHYDSIAKKQPDIPLYTHPAEWQSLSDDEITDMHHEFVEFDSINNETIFDPVGFAHAIEQAHGIGDKK